MSTTVDDRWLIPSVAAIVVVGLFCGVVAVNVLSPVSVRNNEGIPQLRPPPGWRWPASEELAGSWRDAETNRFAVASADFDGDGMIEVAALAVSSVDDQVRLMIIDHDGRGLFSITTDAPMDDLGVRVQDVVLETACVKGYGSPCAPGEATQITSGTPGIQFFGSESGSSLIRWNAEAGKYVEIPLSD